MKRYHWLLLPALIFSIIGCGSDDKPSDTGTSTPPPAAPSINYKLLSTHAHDTSYFTEGLEFYKNTLIESTGNYGKSKLIKMDTATGRVIQSVDLDARFFGEGVTVLNDTLYQLTYKENTVLVYDARTFKKIREFTIRGEGWGLTNDGKSIIASNGSSDIFYYDPATFNLQRTVSVREGGSMVPNINELEYVDGFIYANQWQYSDIIKINAQTGEVVGKIDLSSITSSVKQKEPWADYLNGIAYNPATKKFLITGKYWSQMLEVQF